MQVSRSRSFLLLGWKERRDGYLPRNQKRSAGGHLFLRGKGVFHCFTNGLLTRSGGGARCVCGGRGRGGREGEAYESRKTNSFLTSSSSPPQYKSTINLVRDFCFEFHISGSQTCDRVHSRRAEAFLPFLSARLT